MTIEIFLKQCGGVAGTVAVARFLGVTEQLVRDWARDNDVAVVSGRFILNEQDVEDLRDDIEEEEGDGDDDEDEAAEAGEDDGSEPDGDADDGDEGDDDEDDE